MNEEAPPNGDSDAMSNDIDRGELVASYEVPAVFANRFMATTTPSGMRISFAEVPHGGKSCFRSAVMLGYEDALALSNLIADLIKKHVRFSEPSENGGEAE